MNRIGFVSEMGEGLGHVSRLLELAMPLRAMGYDCIFIVSDIIVAGAKVQNAGFDVIPGPPKKYWLNNPRKIMKSHGDILSQRGYAGDDTLRNLLKSWIALFKFLKPDLLILDYSPTARLAAGEKFKTIVLGTGFTIPPTVNGLIPQFRRGSLIVPEKKLLDNIFKVSAESKTWRPKKLIELFYGEKTFLTVLPELDAFSKFRRQSAVGPLSQLPKPVKGKASKDIFCYLNGEDPYALRIIRKFKNINITGGAYLRGIDPGKIQELSNRDFKIFKRPQDISKISIDTKFILHHGGIGLSQMALALGRPQIILPTQMEQQMNASNLKKLETGEVIRNWRKLGEENLLKRVGSCIEQDKFEDGANKVARGLALKKTSSLELVISECKKLL